MEVLLGDRGDDRAAHRTRGHDGRADGSGARSAHGASTDARRCARFGG
jgi:hypothetical protein